MHHVGTYMMEIEQIDLGDSASAGHRCILRPRYCGSHRYSIDRAGAHATRRALSKDDQGGGADPSQVRDQWCAEETRGAFLVDHEIASHGRKFILDEIEFPGLLAPATMRRLHAAGVGMAGRLDHRHACFAPGCQQRSTRLDCLAGILAAGAEVAPIDFADRGNCHPDKPCYSGRSPVELD